MLQCFPLPPHVDGYAARRRRRQPTWLHLQTRCRNLACSGLPSNGLVYMQVHPREKWLALAGQERNKVQDLLDLAQNATDTAFVARADDDASSIASDLGDHLEPSRCGSGPDNAKHDNPDADSLLREFSPPASARSLPGALLSNAFSVCLV
jgi:hypothetical protein